MAIWWLRRATPNSGFIHTTKFANRRGVGVARHVHILSLYSNFVPRNDMAVVYIAAVHFGQAIKMNVLVLKPTGKDLISSLKAFYPL